MKKILALALALVMVLSLAACTTKNPEKDPAGKKVELTMGSWRMDDVVQMTTLLEKYTELNPNVTIKFQPTNPQDYNAALRLQLDNGTGPDLMYARSYATGIELFDTGFFADCSDIAGLKENFTASNLAPWQTEDGKMFAVPFAAVSHAVYYNKDIFKEAGVEIPTTWEEFLTVCATLKEKGFTPLANGIADEWDILEVFFLGMLPNYVGGAEGRMAYETDEKALNDEAMVAAYTDIAKVAPFLPDGFEAVTYNDSQALFSTAGAAMFIDGSWTLGVYEDAAFDWGVFAIPAPEGKNTAVCFHPDMAITMNAASKNPAEAKAFLAWLCTQEGATTASESLPAGYFPMINFEIALANAQANEFLALNTGKETDARFVWPVLMDLYKPMNDAVIAVIKGAMTPQAAADSVENFVVPAA